MNGYLFRNIHFVLLVLNMRCSNFLFILNIPPVLVNNQRC